MNTAKNEEPTHITPAIEQQASRWVYVTKNTRWDTNEELHRKYRSELSEFDRAMRYFDAVSWLHIGLRLLQDAGEALYFEFSARGPYGKQKPRAELVAAFEKAVADDAAVLDKENASFEDKQRFADVVSVARLWLDQTDYAIWKRARAFEAHMADIARDGALGFIERDGVNMEKEAETYWDRLLASWQKSLGDAAHDHILVNEDLPFIR